MSVAEPAAKSRGQAKRRPFPDDDHSYTVNEVEYEKFAALVAKRRQI